MNALALCMSFAQTTSGKVLSQLKSVIRPMYSSPILHGALIVTRILEDRELRRQWERELQQVWQRIVSIRTRLAQELQRAGVPGDWSFLTRHVGMFSLIGLTPTQCKLLMSKWHCYLLLNGRISLTGVNSGNLVSVVRAIHDVITS